MRFSVNISISYLDIPFLERPGAAARAGFDAIEMWWPVAKPVLGAKMENDILNALLSSGVELALVNLFAGNMAEGDRGVTSYSDSSEVFRAGVDSAVSLAGAAGCRIINVLYGNRRTGIDPRRQDEYAVESLGYAARRADEIGATVVLEGLNSTDFPRYPLVHPEDVIGVVDRVRETSGLTIGYLLDVYHLAVMGHSPADTIRQYGSYIGHVQLADHPGRGVPGEGTINFPGVLQALRDCGYAGFVGFECYHAECFTWSDLVSAVTPARGW